MALRNIAHVAYVKGTGYVVILQSDYATIRSICVGVEVVRFEAEERAREINRLFRSRVLRKAVKE